MPLDEPKRLKFGLLKGKLRYPHDFDAPLPDEVLTLFDGPSNQVTLLFDTHVFLWTLDDSSRLSKAARALMTAIGNECFISAVSFWEIAIKAALRRADFRVDTSRTR